MDRSCLRTFPCFLSHAVIAMYSEAFVSSMPLCFCRGSSAAMIRLQVRIERNMYFNQMFASDGPIDQMARLMNGPEQRYVRRMPRWYEFLNSRTV